jgi:hypothetical protein
MYAYFRCRSQWPHGLRHEPSSPARTLRSWVRIPLEACMSVCIYSVCVVLCVGSGLATYTQPVGLPGRWISLSQGRYVHTEQHKQRINAHIHASSGIRTQDPSVRRRFMP